MAKTNARGGSVRAKASPKAAPKAAERANRMSEATSSFFKNFFRAQSREFYLLIGLVIFIVGVGLLMVLSASFVDSLRANNNAFSIFNKQFISSIVGFVMLFVLATLPIEFIKRMVIPATAIALAVQLAVLLIGTSVNGNKNWINILGFTVQPSEFLKLLGIV